jgi:hypothetical protein
VNKYWDSFVSMFGVNTSIFWGGGGMSKIFELFVMGQSKKLFTQKTYELGR